VTPFAVVNDRGGVVRIALDRGLHPGEIWNAHPLDNGMTTAVRGEDMVRFLEDVGHPPIWIEL
jgi:Ala-tRNA(Pro) deacylase